jgi:hypothetical protein
LTGNMKAQWTIATNLRRILNTYAVEWGLTVSKVEIRLIDPPEDIKKAMHKQKTAEQERRSMRLLATGEFEAAEQQKLAIIQRAEREAVIQVAQGKAEAIRLVNESAEGYFVGNAQLLKRMEMTENSLRENAKIVITENGISPTLLLGSLPVTVSSEEQRQSPLVRCKNWRSLAPQKMFLNIEKGCKNGELRYVPSLQEEDIERPDH